MSDDTEINFVYKPLIRKRATQAPPPPIVLSGRGGFSAISRPMDGAIGLPEGYPDSLKTMTQLTLAEAARDFPDRLDLEKMCKTIVERLCAPMCTAVRKGALPSYAVPGQMRALLDRITFANCTDANERLVITTTVENSQEWLAMLQKLNKWDADSSPRNPVNDRAPESFGHSPDYRSVRFHGRAYPLTDNQACMIEVLHIAFQQGTPNVGKKTLLAAIEQETSRVRDSFKESPLWQKLIVTGDGRGTYKLNPAIVDPK